MDTPRTTKERLLHAACTVFAEKGFRDATVAEICDRAGANIAAVNYHFGDKESLYDAVWHQAFELAARAYAVDALLPDDPTLADYLYSYAHAILSRIFSETETGCFARLLYREMAAPTLALDHIAREVLKPQGEYLKQAIRSSLGDRIGEECLLRCMNNIIGMCAFYNFSRPLRERVLGCRTMCPEEIERTARHIARFSVGGIRETQRDEMNV